MKMKKAVYLFLALLLPVCVFLFLRAFGKNEFAVKPLYTEELPLASRGCNPVPRLPYTIPDNVVQDYTKDQDSLSVIFFGLLKDEAANQFHRVQEKLTGEGISVSAVEDTAAHMTLVRCVFFLEDPNNVVLFDRSGSIRGNYAAADRDEIDRLLTEITIIQKKY